MGGVDEGAAGTSQQPAAASAATAVRIVWDDAALDHLLDRTELEARHRAVQEGGDDLEAVQGSDEEEAGGANDLLKAFKVMG